MNSKKKASHKRLISNRSESPAISNHTEVLEDLEQPLLDEFKYEKKKKAPSKHHIQDDDGKLQVPTTDSAQRQKSVQTPKRESITNYFSAAIKKPDNERNSANKQEPRPQPKVEKKLVQEIPSEIKPTIIKDEQQLKQTGKSYKDMFTKAPQNQLDPGIQDLLQNQLKGQTIVLTGLINVCPRDQLEKVLVQLGAKITGSVSGKTNILIAGEKLEDSRPVEQGKKYKTAQARGTKILTESQIPRWFQELTGVPLDLLFGESQIGKLYVKSLQMAKQTVLHNQQNQWVDRYAPKSLPDLVGHKSSIDQLHNWLSIWGKRKVDVAPNDQKKKNNFSMMQLGRFQLVGDKHSKACMISGPPGIGKSSAVKLLGEVLGYSVLGTNASEQRNKSSVRALLGHLIGNRLLVNNKLSSKFIILMDEVDGMTGSDRGGIQQLIESIKQTQIPIVCICNDHESQKLRSLMSYCYHIRFAKPSPAEVCERLQSVCLQEHVKVSEAELLSLAKMFDSDIRQSINMLQMMQFGREKKLPQWKLFSKDQVTALNVFEAAMSLLNKEERGKLRLRQKLDLFFLDYDLMPLIIQDSYLASMKKTAKQGKKATKKQSKQDHKADNPPDDDYTIADISQMANAAGNIAMGDILNKSIRWKQNWSLMPAYGLFSTILPCEQVSTAIAFPKFPEFWGKNSIKKRITREAREIKTCLAQATFNANIQTIRFEYAPALFRMLSSILRLKFASNDKDAALQAVVLLEHYNLTPDDLKINLHDLIFNPAKQNLLALVETNTKTVLTKIFNKRHQVLKLGPKKAKAKESKEDDKQMNTVYNPALGEEGPIYEKPPQEEPPSADSQEQESKVKRKPPAKKRQNSQSKKPGKKAKSTESFDSEGSIGDFIVSDEDT